MTIADIQLLLKRVDELIQTIQENIRCSFGSALIIFLMGIGLTLYFLWGGVSQFKDIPDLLKLGPGFISLAVSVIPTKFFFESRERIIYYKYLKNCCENSSTLTEDNLLKLKEEVADALKEIRKRS